MTSALFIPMVESFSHREALQPHAHGSSQRDGSTVPRLPAARMTRQKVICLDFDGVVHPTMEGAYKTSVTHFGWLPHLQELLGPHPAVVLVVHSTWRHRFNLGELRMLLDDVLGARLLAAAPDGDDRWQAIQAWAAKQTGALDLLILDDAPSEFPKSMPFTLVVCDPARGLSDPVVQRSIKQWLEQRQRGGGHDDNAL
jgi:HAD domain in Swiss Army Knife RNA repair proteins